jgi:Cu2+-exporting ATPase
MKCAHCEAAGKKAVEALPFITGAQASRDSNTAVIELGSDPDMDAIRSAIEEEGFTFTGVA